MAAHPLLAALAEIPVRTANPGDGFTLLALAEPNAFARRPPPTLPAGPGELRSQAGRC